jgi:hypothetical protein
MKDYQHKANAELVKMDSYLERIFETRDLISGRIINDFGHQIEMVIAFPYSMGERGINFSLYYDSVPEREQLYADWKKELKEYIKPKNFINGIIYCPTAYEEEYIKIGKKVLRKSK